MNGWKSSSNVSKKVLLGSTRVRSKHSLWVQRIFLGNFVFDLFEFLLTLRSISTESTSLPSDKIRESASVASRRKGLDGRFCVPGEGGMFSRNAQRTGTCANRRYIFFTFSSSSPSIPARFFLFDKYSHSHHPSIVATINGSVIAI